MYFTITSYFEELLHFSLSSTKVLTILILDNGSSLHNSTHCARSVNGDIFWWPCVFDPDQFTISQTYGENQRQ